MDGRGRPDAQTLNREEVSLANTTEQKITVAKSELTLIKGGAGKPLLMLHDELGFPGWVKWNDELAAECEFVIPLQPGFDKTPRIDWIRSFRDLASFYSMAVRDMGLGPVDVIAFSAGGYIAAEMVASDPSIFNHMILVGPMGIKPEKGEIFDIFPVTIRTHLRATVADPGNPAFGTIYGGDMTPEQFEAFEEARAESARIGWEPYMHNPSLPYLLRGVENVPTLLIRGAQDKIVPQGCIDAYKKAINGSRSTLIADAGHRPEVESSAEFVKIVSEFLAS